jgi:hypothetical protein
MLNNNKLQQDAAKEQGDRLPQLSRNSANPRASERTTVFYAAPHMARKNTSNEKFSFAALNRAGKP